MEIGNQGIHGLEPIARIDEDIRPSGLGCKGSVLIDKGFQRPAGGGSHADNPSPGCSGFVEDGSCLVIHHAQLAVHMVFQNLLRLHRAEGAKPNMEGDKGRIHALCPDGIQQLLRKVQTGSGGCGRANLPGIDGLIPLLILQFCLDVGRQRHFSQPLQHFQKNSGIVEFHHPVSILLYGSDGGSQFPISKNHFAAHLHFPAGLAKALPAAVSQIPKQQHLHGAAGGSVTQKSCRQNPGIVHHQTVAGVQVVDDIIKMLMLPLPCFPVQAQQTGGVPFFQRCLGNQLLRQVIVKIMGFQADSSILSVFCILSFILVLV